MKSKNKSFYFLIGLLLLSCVVSWKLYMQSYWQTDTVNIHLFPKVINGWTSEEMLITEREYAILETNNAFARKYIHEDGREVYVFIVYSENNRKVSHPPEVCYTGGGVSVTENDPVQLKLSEQERGIYVNRLLLEKKGSQQLAYYWFKVGSDFTKSYWKQQFLIMFKTLSGKPASSALIRLSVNVVDENMALAEKTIESFSKEIGSSLHQYLP